MSTFTELGYVGVSMSETGTLYGCVAGINDQSFEKYQNMSANNLAKFSEVKKCTDLQAQLLDSLLCVTRKLASRAQKCPVQTLSNFSSPE